MDNNGAVTQSYYIIILQDTELLHNNILSRVFICETFIAFPVVAKRCRKCAICYNFVYHVRCKSTI